MHPLVSTCLQWQQHLIPGRLSEVGPQHQAVDKHSVDIQEDQTLFPGTIPFCLTELEDRVRFHAERNYPDYSNGPGKQCIALRKVSNHPLEPPIATLTLSHPEASDC